MDWEDLGYIKASRHRIAIVNELQNSVQTPKELTESLGVHFSQTSKTLNELEEQNIIVCVNPNMKKGRLYRLTGKGEELSELLQEKD